MKTYTDLWKQLCTFDNLEEAYMNARKHKTMNPRVQEFDKHWRLHLCVLLRELRTKTYKPKPLRKFILRDPKTRTICVSDFRDRIVHHLLINAIQPIFEPTFISDSYASRRLKGTLPALNRFDVFKRKVTCNGTKQVYILKCDIEHYFETVDHAVLLSIIREKVHDDDLEWLIRVILSNYETGVPGKGMPLGNWTSQFFANIYLDKLDQFVKHELKAKYYIRYVDDFVILDRSKEMLQEYKEQINSKLGELKLSLHPGKCKIIPLEKGTSFLGFRVFYHHKLVRKLNWRKVNNKIESLLAEHEEGIVDAERVLESLHGWSAYAMHGNTYRLRTKLLERTHNELKRIAENKIGVPPPNNSC